MNQNKDKPSKLISLLVFDFDGVMTDNKVYVDQNGNEMVQVNRADGIAIGEIKNLGIEQIIISTEENPVVAVRAAKLQIPYLQGIKNKKNTLEDYCQENGFLLEQVGYVGNDINDKEAMKIVGTAICPSDAHDNIKIISDHILMTNGGDGVIRELLDLLTK